MNIKKYIKKINEILVCKIILIMFFMFFNFHISYAETNGSCLIEDAPAPVLQEYINNVKIITQNISNKMKSNNNEKKTIDRIKAEGNAFWNKISDWEGYFTSFKFYAILPFSGEVPYQITRDYKLIENNIAFLDKYYGNLISNGYGSESIDNICSGVQNCNLKGKAIDIVGQITENSRNILDIYALSLLNERENNNSKLILVPDDFLVQFDTYYNEFSIKDCSNIKGGFWDTAKEAINNISFNGLYSEKSIKDWKDARAMLVGTNSDQEYFEQERDILSKELGRQGIQGNSNDTILGNLDRFNNQGLSVDNNFLTNSFKSTYKGLKNQVNDFSDTIYQSFGGSQIMESGKSKNNEEVGIKNITTSSIKIVKTEDIRKKIDEVYNLEIPFASEQDNNNMELIGRIVKMHIRLSQASNTLDKATPIAEQVCDGQDRGNGKCRYR